MEYPTIEEVEAADHVQLCRWYRFLKSPGIDSAGEDNFNSVFKLQSSVMNRIVQRVASERAMTTAISKVIGW